MGGRNGGDNAGRPGDHGDAGNRGRDGQHQCGATGEEGGEPGRTEEVPCDQIGDPPTQYVGTTWVAWGKAVADGAVGNPVVGDGDEPSTDSPGGRLPRRDVEGTPRRRGSVLPDVEDDQGGGCQDKEEKEEGAVARGETVVRRRRLSHLGIVEIDSELVPDVEERRALTRFSIRVNNQ